MVVIFDLRNGNHEVLSGIPHTALYDTLLIGPSDIAEVRLKEVMTDQTLKFSGVFTFMTGKYLRDCHAGYIKMAGGSNSILLFILLPE